MIWSDSAWKRRLTERLEPILKSPNLAKEISTYQGVPFGLFAYPPTAERDVRREVRMLAIRIEHETPRRVTMISMADLLWEAVRTAYPPDGKALFEVVMTRSPGAKRWTPAPTATTSPAPSETGTNGGDLLTLSLPG
jgi:hypothetical protein